MGAPTDDDAFPPAEDGPRFELQSIGRILDDLAPAEKVTPATRARRRALIYSALAVLALIAFFGWLLVGPAIT